MHVMANSTAADRESQNPFACNICKRTYGRADHLARHFRSHTNERPFTCNECGKGFARVDLLTRHANLHVEDARSNKKRKIRASRACQSCAAMKMRCDQQKPCTRCRANGTECRVAPISLTQPGEGSVDGGSSHNNDNDDSTHSLNTLAIETSLHQQPNLLTPPSTFDTTLGSNVAILDDDLSLTDFIRDIFLQEPLSEVTALRHTNGTYTPRNLMDFSQDLSLDFHDFNAALHDGWDAWLDSANTAATLANSIRPLSDVSTPSIDDSIGMGSAAFRRSAWRWNPNHETILEDQANLASSAEDASFADSLTSGHLRRLSYPVDQRARDRIVAKLLTVCDKSNYQRIVGFFPMAPILDAFVNNFLGCMERSIDHWIHIPTLDPRDCIAEFLALMVAGGAISSSSMQAQRLGYALNETCRQLIAPLFDLDNSNTRCLQALQAFALYLDIGIWSGNKRTMELAESQALPLITMLRRSGRLRRSHTDLPHPTTEDSPTALEHKWRDWIEAESFKRLAYHMFLHCAQVSIAFRTPPLISYAEINLCLPAPGELWRADNAAEWRDRYLASKTGHTLPSFVQSFYDPHGIGLVRDRIDLNLTLYLVLLSHWCVTWEYIQLNSVNKAQTTSEIYWTGSLLASSKRQELRLLMDKFQAEIKSWAISVPKEVEMVSQILRMNLCVAFEDLQQLAGKEGEDEARRVLPNLKQWFKSPESRMAMCHAGQIVRIAREPSHRNPNARAHRIWLRGFHAVALYHAALAFWVYGLLSRTDVDIVQSDIEGLTSHGTFHVDGDESEQSWNDRQHFISLSKSIPVISSGTANNMAIRLDSTKQITDAIILIITGPESITRGDISATDVQRPAMVENLTQLLSDLGEAASAI